MSGEPAFEVEGPSFITTGCYLTRVRMSTEAGLVHRFYGTTERQSRARAEIYMAEQLGRASKLEARKHAARAGRMKQALRATSGQPDKPEEAAP